ncbi:hypothetical protein [Alicyclobacillus shizuokensis]|uniref:hypothetical protein n=1 Tax=Alicyclobacillus shizuokensis TaxID=392014 RepID=UPI0008373D5F|nr:hypothetical protein [Alicyclobacillus shizuokensis]
MWTVVWTDNQGRHQAQRDLTKPEVIELLRRLKRELQSLDQVAVFRPHTSMHPNQLLEVEDSGTESGGSAS